MAVKFNYVPGGADVYGKTHVNFIDVTLDNSYPATTGYVINASDIGLKNFLGAQVVGGNKAAGKLTFLADFLGTAGVGGDPAPFMALRAFFPTGGSGSAPITLAAPAAGATTPGAITVTNGVITPGAITFPTSTTPVLSDSSHPVFTEATPTQATTTASQAAGTGGAITPGVAKEVGNTADLSTIIVRLQVFGF